MIRMSRILLVVAVTLAAGAAQAQTVNWNYLEGGWGTVDPDAGSREDGWFVGGAVGLGKLPLHVYGEFGDFGPLDQWQVGFGWHGLLGKRADLFADGAFFDADIEDGFKIRFGVRWMLLKRLELNGHLGWTELDFTDNQSAAVNGIFDFTKRFGVGGGFEWGSDVRAARVFARFNFGSRE
jgi:hypothetical protein